MRGFNQHVLIVVIGLDKNGYEVLSLNPTGGGIQLMTGLEKMSVFRF